jgi:hypothetical protein
VREDLKMAVIVRLKNEMPPCIVPPYSLDENSKVSEVLEAACTFYKRKLDNSKLIDFESGEELSDTNKTLREYGLGHWSFLELQPTEAEEYKRVTFG